MAGPTITLTIAGDARDAQRALRTVGNEADGLNGKLEKSGGSFEKWKGRLVTASTAIVGVAGLVGKELIGVASEAEQSLGAVDSVFKSSSGQIKKWADDAANNLGLSAHQYREMATVIGAQFKNMGVAQDQLAGQTNSLIQTGADLAAMFGGTTADAVEALTSAFRGEFDPIERYGIAIKQSDVNARLASKGLDKLTGAALRSATQQEIMAMIAEQSADAQGQFGREADTAAGQQQRLTAQVENLKEKLGNALLPAFTTVMGFINGTVIPWLGRNTETVKTLGVAIVGLAGFILAANAAMKVYNATMIAVRGVTAGITAATKAWTVAQKALNLVMNMSPLGRIIALITTIIGVVAAVGAKMGWLKDLWKTVTNGIASAAKWVGDKIASAWQWCVDKVKKIWNGIGDFFDGLWDGITSGIKAAINAIISVINGVIDGINLIIKGINHIPGVDIGLIGKIPKLHTGGTVPGAPGQEVMTVLQAGEKVVRAGANRGGEVTIRAGDEMTRVFVEAVRKQVRQQAGGDVQVYFGR